MNTYINLYIGITNRVSNFKQDMSEIPVKLNGILKRQREKKTNKEKSAYRNLGDCEL